uniref:Nucleoside-diphosphate kinase n=1 Tax=Florenciella parvula TaxID=236787 RepID=A0A7S2D7U9_9STRA|mmetsp:Transcript_9432/g.19945  ORF Transcript_9432/g.19945 Transcript_9432/m.19945 type:complete len:382 (+) Transcript_9432:61-1206(+)
MAHSEEIALACDKTAGGWDWSSGVSYNTALVFIKPHAVNDAVKAFVSSELKAQSLDIIAEGRLTGPEIESGGIIDNHYAAIATNAMKVEPADIAVADDKKAKFAEAFECSWDSVLTAGTVMNVTKALEVLAQTGTGLAAVWDKGVNKIKLASGCYVSKCTYAMVNNDEGDDVGVPCEEGEDGATTIYLINGFYGAMRESYITESAQVYFYVVGFTSDKVTWNKFRTEIIGPTNPDDAPEGSIRGKGKAQWESLGMPGCPNVGENVVHASAGPLEGLKERCVWLGLNTETDPFGQKLAEVIWSSEAGDTMERLLADDTFEFAGVSMGAFDLTENKESLEVLCICNNLAYATPDETKEFYAVEPAAQEEAAPAEGEAKAEEAA